MFNNSKDGRAKFLRIVVFNTVWICLLIGAISLRRIPIYPIAPIFILALFLLNIIIIWRVYRQPSGDRGTKAPISKVAWLGVGGATVVCIALFVAWIRKPDIQSTVQMFIGILIAAYAWFIVRSLRRNQG